MEVSYNNYIFVVHGICDFGICDFGICDFGICDFGICDFGICDFGICDFGIYDFDQNSWVVIVSWLVQSDTIQIKLRFLQKIVLLAEHFANASCSMFSWVLRRCSNYVARASSYHDNRK